MSSDEEFEGINERASIGSWIFALVVCLIMLLGFAWYKYPEWLTQQFSGDIAQADTGDEKEPRSKKKRRKKRKKRGGKTVSSDDIEWENDDDYEDPGIELGDIFDREGDDIVEEVVNEEPAYDPPPEVYQPSGRYRPSASYREAGASTSNVSSVDMSKSGSNRGLRDDQIRSRLTVSKLMPCYAKYASKVPQMKGRVDFKLIAESDGHVSLVTVTSSQLRSKVVEKCMVQKVKSIRFPAADRATKFSQHFQFD